MNTHSDGQEGSRSNLDSTISVQHNAVVKNVGNTKSLRLALNAMCFHCMGCTEDYYVSGTKDEIRSCTSVKCPLWCFRPYATEQGGGA